jgi:hypothetical protein
MKASWSSSRITQGRVDGALKTGGAGGASGNSSDQDARIVVCAF